MSILFHNVEIRGARADLRVVGDRIAEIGTGLPLGSPADAVRTESGNGPTRTPDTVVDGRGGALLPGLHDHHIHLLALAAALRSVDCGPSAVANAADLRRVLAARPGRGWLRGTGYHESVAGDLDRDVLDRLLPDRPVRIQHRSGALWMLNSLALEQISSVLDDSADVGRDATGRPTGRLWRYDARLRAALPDDPPDLAEVGALLTRYGLTGVTDATPDLDDSAIAVLAEARREDVLPQHITLLGAPTEKTLATNMTTGPRKLLLRDHDLPPYDRLAATIADTHRSGRPVAVHCVTRESLLLTLAALDDVGSIEGDRIEHAGVVPGDVAEQISRLGAAVVTQPGFLSDRGDTYRREVDPDDLPHLYPHARLLRAGVPVALSSDAPYGPVDPWTVMRSAVERSTRTGTVLGPEERVDPAVALAGYLGSPDRPGGPPRRLTPGASADLCLLHVPLAEALESLDSNVVRTVVIGGRTVAEERHGR
ncbi:amidohydrolase family protein [Nocardia sp. BMG51109]|uniref:amidohydrolase family protein n=1 Tax=Nocardia sp. BMG51109 TaxID=1056816 RepID=UPI00046570C8|nr:amidohydrolase family protein [Nocardia sp. BMG51109]